MSLDQILLNAGGGETVTGSFGEQELTQLQKSLTAGYGSDTSQLTGGSAMRIQSLDTTMQATVQDNKHFVLFNRLAKPSATATVDEWTEQSSVGGFLGGSTNTEIGAATETEGEYQRQVGQVKYLSTYRKVSMVLNAGNNIVSAQAAEAANGAKQLLTDIEYLAYEGDDTVVPTEFAGIRRQIEALGSSDHIIDMFGQPLNSMEPISQAAATIFGFENFGTATDLFTSVAVQTDLNNHLDPAFRVALNSQGSNIVLGTAVEAVKTSFGDVKTNQDVFIRDEKMKLPFEIRKGKHPLIAANNNVYKPQAVAANAVAAGGPQSKWGAAQAGNYYYLVTGVTSAGQSTGVLTSQVAATAGGKVTLTITGSSSGQETGYVIYKSRLNGTNNLSDLRELCRIPKQQGGQTVWDDLFLDVPGSTTAYVLNMNPSDHAISWKQYMPMFKIPMAAVNSPIIPWLQMVCGYLRITKRRQHIVIKNIVPSGALWKPF